jgi:ring-1,2-phenylacetyl-CoA epoxidase subunit PaaE
MGLFDRFKSNKNNALPKGAHHLVVKSVEKLTNDAVQIEFDIPSLLQANFNFTAGQYLTLELDIDGEKLRRSYSICSGEKQGLCIGVKAIEKGKASNYLQRIEKGTSLLVFEPEGNFTWNPNNKNVVAIAAGSGITPIMGMLKTAGDSAHFHLFYGNKSAHSSLFLNEIQSLTNTSTHLYFSKENQDGAIFGRIDEAALKTQIKQNLSLLQADAFYLCGPQALVEMAEKTLAFFGVAEQKIHKELFFVSNTSKQTEVIEQFSGKSQVKVMIDGEIAQFEMQGTDKSILELAEKAGLDAPFSCRGGVCSSCRAKVLKGSASMRMNHSLTDNEVAEGYILTCQAHATSQELIVNYDE